MEPTHPASIPLAKALRIDGDAARRKLADALLRCGGNIARTARFLGYSREYLHRLIAREETGPVADALRVSRNPTP